MSPRYRMSFFSVMSFDYYYFIYIHFTYNITYSLYNNVKGSIECVESSRGIVGKASWDHLKSPTTSSSSLFLLNGGIMLIHEHPILSPRGLMNGGSTLIQSRQYILEYPLVTHTE